jgi:hypothetical protein
MFALRQHLISRRRFLLLQARCSHVSGTGGWPTKEIESTVDAQIFAENITSNKMEKQPDYNGWSHEDLIKRVTQLEKELKEKTQRCAVPEEAPHVTIAKLTQPAAQTPHRKGPGRRPATNENSIPQNTTRDS